MSAELVDRVRARLAGEEATAVSVGHAVRAELGVVDRATVLALVDQMADESLGAGVLRPLLTLPGVTDVLVNGPDAVFVDRGAGLERCEVSFADDAAVRRLAQRLAAQAGRRLDDASPWVDARLPDGVRLHAVLAPVARPGTAISLRVPAARTFSLGQLAERGMIDRSFVGVLERIVAARVAFVVTGGTGSGKTTLLAALLGLVPAQERIVVVEEATELRPDHPHVVGLEARPPNVEGAGTVSLRDLVRQALRMRPDRLVVGEVRGAEVVDLLAALNTGHAGGAGTLHANSVHDVPARFEALAMAAGLSRSAVHSQLAAGIGVVVHVARRPDRSRFVSHLGVFERDGEGLVRCVPALGAESPVGRDRLEELIGT